MNIELVVFDMAGTTVAEGGAVYRSLQATLAANGLVISDKDLHQVKGRDKREALRVLIEQSPMCDELMPGLTAIHDDFVERMMEFYRTANGVTEADGASQIFALLHQKGIKIAINTGFSREIAQVLFDRLGWQQKGLIDASVTSDEVEAGRPHPFMIRHLMAELGITDAQLVAKVGDTPADLWEGKNANCGLIVGVTGGSSTAEQLVLHPHDCLVSSIIELPAKLILTSQNGFPEVG